MGRAFHTVFGGLKPEGCERERELRKMHDPAVFRSMHRARFGAEPAIFVAPGRVNLIGEHTDYAEGFVMPAAINFATLAGISPRTDGKIASLLREPRRGKDI